MPTDNFLLVQLIGGNAAGRADLARALVGRLARSGIDCAVSDEADLTALSFPMAGEARHSLHLLLAAEEPLDAAQEARDLRWREELTRQGIAYSVLHGDSQARLEAAWRMLAPLLDLPQEAPQAPTRGSASWQWRCDKCSDPACEHRLFQDLLASRAAPPPGTDAAG